jgi:3-methyladenine DNA glycosylase AlkD
MVTDLKAFADPVRAEGEIRYFKGTINALETGSANLQAVEKRLCKGLEKTWSVDDALALCDYLLPMRVFEVTICALTALDRFAGKMGSDELDHFRSWLEADLLDNWAAVDTLCPHTVGTVIQKKPELAAKAREWADSDNQWCRRASAVSFILLARKGQFLDLCYEIAEVLFADKSHDLVQKGNGWMLREAGKTDSDRLERFLFQHGPNIPRTTLRYAIEKFPKEKRAELLVATKRSL